jgi:hypothetical protein
LCLRGTIVVDNTEVYILHLIVGRQRQHDQLNEGHDKDHRQDGTVAEDLFELLLE